MNLSVKTPIKQGRILLLVIMSLSNFEPALGESALKDDQIDTLRNLSQSLLAARKVRKEALLAQSQPDRQQLQELIGAMDDMETQANRALYQAKGQVKSQVSTVADIRVAPVTRVGSVRFDPTTKTFSPIGRRGQSLPPVTKSSSQSRVPVVAATDAVNQQAVVRRQALTASLNQVQAKIAQVRQSMQSRVPKTPSKGRLGRLAELLGLSKPAQSAPVPTSTASVLRLANEVDQVISAVPTNVDPHTLLEKTRALKKRLTLSVAVRSAKPLEPTFTTRTTHR